MWLNILKPKEFCLSFHFMRANQINLGLDFNAKMKKIKGMFSLVMYVIKMFVAYLRIHCIIFKLAELFTFLKEYFT